MYKSVTEGKFSEALRQVQTILHIIPLTVVDSRREVDELKELISIARQAAPAYIVLRLCLPVRQEGYHGQPSLVMSNSSVRAAKVPFRGGRRRSVAFLCQCRCQLRRSQRSISKKPENFQPAPDKGPMKGVCLTLASLAAGSTARRSAWSWHARR